MIALVEEFFLREREGDVGLLLAFVFLLDLRELETEGTADSRSPVCLFFGGREAASLLLGLLRPFFPLSSFSGSLPAKR